MNGQMLNCKRCERLNDRLNNHFTSNTLGNNLRWMTLDQHNHYCCSILTNYLMATIKD